MKKAYIYLRVSTDEQAKEGFSLDNQRRACFEYAKSNNYKVEDVFLEDGKSARTTNRPAFQELLKTVKDKPVDAIIVYKIDRFARNVADFSNLRKQFKKAGIKLMSLVEGGDVTEGLIGNIFASVAEWESEINGKRTKDAMMQKFRDGWWPGWAPLGYKNVKRGNKRIVIIDKEIGPKIKKCFEKYSAGTYSISELCEIMYSEEGLSARNGKIMPMSSMQQILTNKFYYGHMTWAGEINKGNHTSLITKPQFDQCRYVLAKHRQFLIRRSKHTFLLRGFIRCPIHNNRVTAEWHKVNSKKRDRVGYYHCHARGGCPGSYLRTEDLEKRVSNLFKKFEFSPEFVDLVQGKVKEYFKTHRDDLKSKRQVLVNKRKALEKSRDRLEDLLTEGTIDRTIFKRQHAKLQASIYQIDDQLEELNLQHQLDVNLIDEILAMTRNVHKAYGDAPDFLKRHYLRFFFETIYIQDKKIVKVTETPILSELKRQYLVLRRTNWLPSPSFNINEGIKRLIQIVEEIGTADRLPKLELAIS